jgi:hypothetical protein
MLYHPISRTRLPLSYDRADDAGRAVETLLWASW